VNQVHNEKMWAWKERRLTERTAHRVVKEWEEDTPTESRSSNEEEEEGEITLPPRSSPQKTPPPFIDIISR
jgi:hypothetical protein